eukprot:353152-Chlamydomonas_euryale.AAC.5
MMHRDFRISSMVLTISIRARCDRLTTAPTVSANFFKQAPWPIAWCCRAVAFTHIHASHHVPARVFLLMSGRQLHDEVERWPKGPVWAGHLHSVLCRVVAAAQAVSSVVLLRCTYHTLMQNVALMC